MVVLQYSMNRRDVLRTTAAIPFVLTAGCNSPDMEQAGGDRTVNPNVRNDSTQAVIVDVFFTDDDRNTVFSRRYNLEPDTLNESAVFTGNPTHVYCIIDESEAHVETLEYSHCTPAQTVVTGIVIGTDQRVTIDSACSG